MPPGLRKQLYVNPGTGVWAPQERQGLARVLCAMWVCVLGSFITAGYSMQVLDFNHLTNWALILNCTYYTLYLVSTWVPRLELVLMRWIVVAMLQLSASVLTVVYIILLRDQQILEEYKRLNAPDVSWAAFVGPFGIYNFIVHDLPFIVNLTHFVYVRKAAYRAVCGDRTTGRLVTGMLSAATIFTIPFLLYLAVADHYVVYGLVMTTWDMCMTVLTTGVVIFMFYASNIIHSHGKYKIYVRQAGASHTDM